MVNNNERPTPKDCDSACGNFENVLLVAHKATIENPRDSKEAAEVKAWLKDVQQWKSECLDACHQKQGADTGFSTNVAQCLISAKTLDDLLKCESLRVASSSHQQNNP